MKDFQLSRSIHKAAFATMSILASTLLLTSCSESGRESSDSSQNSLQAESEAQSQDHQFSEAVEVDGIKLKVNSVTEYQSLPYLEEGIKSEVAATETLAPQSGGKYVQVETTVENTGKKAWNLTCGFAIQAKVLDSEDREFEPIDSLYRIPGNPDCSDQTNPGFSKTMKWAYEVPKDAKITRFGFANPETSFDKLTFINIEGAPKGSAEVPAPSSSSKRTPAPQANSAPEQSQSAANSESQTQQRSAAQPQQAIQEAPAANSSPAYGNSCSAGQVLQPATGAGGESLVCINSGAGYNWVYGPSAAGVGTASEGAVCADGETGGQDDQGRMMMCIDGEWIYGP